MKISTPEFISADCLLDFKSVTSSALFANTDLSDLSLSYRKQAHNKKEAILEQEKNEHKTCQQIVIQKNKKIFT